MGIAQLVIERLSMSNCVETDSLDETLRGAGGFGSTGVSDKSSIGIPAPTAETGIGVMTNTCMSVKRLHPDAVLPLRGSVDAAGFDLAAAEPIVIAARGRAIVKTKLSLAVPNGTYA